jgi:hypothetical protein
MVETSLDKRIQERYGDNPIFMDVAMELKEKLIIFFNQYPDASPRTPTEQEAFIAGMLFMKQFTAEKKENEIAELEKQIKDVECEIELIKKV